MPRTPAQKAVVLAFGALLAFALGQYSAPRPPRRAQLDDFPAVLRGPALVNDGDSIVVSQTRIRLFGIDAFERDQLCGRANGTHFPCGQVARVALERLVGSSSVTCERRDVDTYGRMVARCTIGATDLSAEQVLEGVALAYREYSVDYVDEEDEARGKGRGAWDGKFTAPWDYRRERR